MAFTIPELKKIAAEKGFGVIVLDPGEKLPEDLRGQSFKRTWLCVPAGTDGKLIYAASVRFAKIYTYGSENDADETDSSDRCNEAEIENNAEETNENEMDR